MITGANVDVGESTRPESQSFATIRYACCDDAPSGSFHETRGPVGADAEGRDEVVDAEVVRTSVHGVAPCDEGVRVGL